jgi:predicted nuclease of predicted toxin-antitoxin system
MRFLVDENLPVDIARLLVEGGHDALYVPHSEHRGAPDLEIWRLAAREDRVVVTRDLDFPLREMPRPPGVLLIRAPDTFTRPQIAVLLSNFIETGALQQVTGTVTVVSPGRVRARAL